MSKLLNAAAAGVLSALISGGAHAQADAYPSKPISLVVTFAAGSGSDIAARHYAKALKDKLNATAVVDIKPGAAGMIGGQAVARAAPDGYTVLMGSGTVNAANYPLYRDRIGYQPQSFAPVAVLFTSPATLFVAKATGGDTVAAVLREARRANPNLSCGSGNAVTQVACQMLAKKTGTDIVNIPYKGNAQSLTDLVGGQIGMAFSDLTAAGPFLQRGSVRAVAVPASARMANMPDVRTFAEQGITDFEFLSWNTLFVPVGTPREAIQKLNEAARYMLSTPEWEALRIATNGIKVSGEIREAQEFVAAEIAKWDRYVRETGVKGSD